MVRGFGGWVDWIYLDFDMTEEIFLLLLLITRLSAILGIGALVADYVIPKIMEDQK